MGHLPPADSRPRRALPPQPGHADPALARPTPPPRARAHAARRGATAHRHLRARAPRFAPVGPERHAPPPCPEGRRQVVTCLCRLARALLEARDRARGAEQRLVELANERAAVFV